MNKPESSVALLQKFIFVSPMPFALTSPMLSSIPEQLATYVNRGGSDEELAKSWGEWLALLEWCDATAPYSLAYFFRGFQAMAGHPAADALASSLQERYPGELLLIFEAMQELVDFMHKSREDDYRLRLMGEALHEKATLDAKLSAFFKIATDSFYYRGRFASSPVMADLIAKLEVRLMLRGL